MNKTVAPFSMFKSVLTCRLMLFCILALATFVMIRPPLVPYRHLIPVLTPAIALGISFICARLCFYSDKFWNELKEALTIEESCRSALEKLVNQAEYELAKINNRHDDALKSIIAKRNSSFESLRERLGEINQRRLTEIAFHDETTKLFERIRVQLSEERASELAVTEPPELSSLLDQFDRLIKEERDERHSLTEQSMEKFLQETLSSFRISRTALPKLSDQHVSVLQENGVATAADVSAARLQNLPGFSGIAKATILTWQRELQEKAKSELPDSFHTEISNIIDRKYLHKKTELSQRISHLESTSGKKSKLVRAVFDTAIQELVLLQSEDAGSFRSSIGECDEEYGSKVAQTAQSLAGLFACAQEERRQHEQQVRQILSDLNELNLKLDKSRECLLSYGQATFRNFVRQVLLLRPE